MSCDFWLELRKEPCPHCGHDPSGVVFSWRGCTSNLRDVWVAAGAPLDDWDGRRAEEVREPLRVAIGRIAAEPARYRRLEAANGWGKVDELLPLLRDLLAAMDRHSGAVFRVEC